MLTRRISLLVAAGALLTAGCGSSASTGPAASASSTAAAVAPATAAAVAATAPAATTAAPATSAPAATAPVAVKIADFAFAPAALTVPAGTTVRWTNADAFAHSVRFTGGAFAEQRTAPGASITVTFAAPGTYAYVCGIHNSMTGTVVVTP